MIGDEQWMVTIQGRPFKGPMSKKDAEAMAEKYQRGLGKHRDMGDWVEIKRDLTWIKKTDEQYKRARQGEHQQFQLEWTEEG